MKGHRDTVVPDSPILGYRASTGYVASPIMMSLAVMGAVFTPSAVADPAPEFKEAVAAARGGQCALRYDPIVEHVAEIVNRSSDDYISQKARHVPADDPLPILKDLGGKAGKTYLLQGAAPNDGAAIKGALLEGHTAIPDCSYTDFGVSLLRNADTGESLAVAVLAGA